MTEEEIMINQQDLVDEDGYIYSYPQIPYFLIDDEIGENKRQKYASDFAEIIRFYNVYKYGTKFITEGSNNDYLPSNLRYKKSAMIMNKEARFLFSNPPTFNVNVDNVNREFIEENAIVQDYLDKVLEKTKFNNKLLKGLKDCFIGKRICIVVNFDEKTGITITFLKSLEFVYELSEDNTDTIKKLVTFYQTNETDYLTEQRWFKKVYTKEKDGVYVTQTIHSGTNELIETVMPKTKIRFDIIPAVVILNDGLTGDVWGESELSGLHIAEGYYSKLSNSDMDAERKSMNPIRYTVDASEASTKNLPTSPGSYWDLQTDNEKPTDANVSAKVGTLEAQMNYSTPLKTTLDRIENQMYAELDVPNITSEQLAGVITSGKTIQALYWGLTVRCDEKMLAWGPELSMVADLIIQGGILYPNCIKGYTEESSIPDIPYDIIVENNYPIPEDVKEEKELDIAEVESNIMSRKFYMKKWRKLNDQEADEELMQIQKEKELLENSYMEWDSSETVDVDNGDSLTEAVINQRKQVDNSSKISEKS